MTRTREFCWCRRMSAPSGAEPAQNPHLVVYQGDKGPGAGKHIVLLAGDHEYRGEESLPALARIMARHYGFKCSVFFTTDPADRIHRTGQFEHRRPRGARRRPTSWSCSFGSRISPTPRCSTSSTTWIAAARSSGIRTATHAFQIKRPDAKFLKYTWNDPASEYTGGFGRQILGRDLGVALRPQPQAELAPAAAARPGEPPDPARREGRLGAVGRLHGRPDRRQPRAGAGPDPRTG